VVLLMQHRQGAHSASIDARRHFEDHGNCEKDDRPAQTAFSEALL
jgi:hypothetical protein